MVLEALSFSVINFNGLLYLCLKIPYNSVKIFYVSNLICHHIIFVLIKLKLKKLWSYQLLNCLVWRNINKLTTDGIDFCRRGLLRFIRNYIWVCLKSLDMIRHMISFDKFHPKVLYSNVVLGLEVFSWAPQNCGSCWYQTLVLVPNIGEPGLVPTRSYSFSTLMMLFLPPLILSIVLMRGCTCIVCVESTIVGLCLISYLRTSRLRTH